MKISTLFNKIFYAIYGLSQNRPPEFFIYCVRSSCGEARLDAECGFEAERRETREDETSLFLRGKFQVILRLSFLLYDILTANANLG